MSGITLKEYGLTFVWECLKEYLGHSWPLLLIFLAGTAAAILIPVFGRKKEAELDIVDAKEYVPGKYEDKPASDLRSEAWMFLGIVIFCALTVMNPFLVRILIPKLGMTTVYYRFFWILPITFGAAAWLARAVGSLRKKMLQAAVFALICAGLAILIPLNPAVSILRMPTNVYKVDGAVPVLCEEIHKDYEQTSYYEEAAKKLEAAGNRNSRKWLKVAGEQYPLCVFPYGIEFAVRQYDPTIRLLFNRNLRLFYEGNTSTGISYTKKNTRYMRRKRILDAMYGRDPDLTEKKFKKAMKKTGTQYLIVEENRANETFLLSAGCSRVSVTAGYIIYRYDQSLE